MLVARTRRGARIDAAYDDSIVLSIIFSFARGISSRRLVVS